jgi:gamma-glutamyltranspeptidase
VTNTLEAMGHRLQTTDDMGDVHAIMIDPATALRLGASDPRQDGLTLGN